MVKPNLVDNDNKVSFLKAVCSLVGGSRCNTQQQLQCSARLMAYLMQFMLTLDSFVKELHLSGYVCVIISLMICPAVQQSHPTRFMAELKKVTNLTESLDRNPRVMIEDQTFHHCIWVSLFYQISMKLQFSVTIQVFPSVRGALWRGRRYIRESSGGKYRSNTCQLITFD